MANPKPITIEGPWKGLEFREPFQSARHAEIAVNVDFSGGKVEARKGFKVVAPSSIRRPLLHAMQGLDGQTYLLALGVLSDNTVQLSVYRPDGTLVEDHRDMSASDGEPEGVRFEASFVDTFLSVGGVPHPVTVILTKRSGYIFDPTDLHDSTTNTVKVRPIDAASDSARLNASNFAYWDAPLRGSIAVEHQSRIYCAGFAEGDAVVLSNTIEEGQAAVPEQWLSEDRAALALAPYQIAYTDEYDLGIQVHHIFAVEDRERVTGLLSAFGLLLIFTDRNVYGMSGGTDETFQIDKLVSGVGCVSQGSITEVGGQVYWMAADGVYTWAPGAPTAVKISVPIDACWTGRYDRTRVPEEAASLLSTLGWPFRIAHSDLRYTQALHYAERNQLWFSVPVQSRTVGAFPVVLVYDYVLQAWSAYTMTPSSRTDGELVGPMFSGVSLRGQGREQVITANALGELQVYGHYRDGTSDGGGSWYGVPMVWCTGRLLADGVAHCLFRPMKFKLLSTGSTPASSPPRYYAEAERAHASVGQSGRGQWANAADLPTQPDSSAQAVWGSSTWGSFTWSDVDWFTAKAEAAISSESIRLGVLDDPSTQDRPNLVVLESVTIEVTPGASR